MYACAHKNCLVTKVVAYFLLALVVNVQSHIKAKVPTAQLQNQQVLPTWKFGAT